MKKKLFVIIGACIIAFLGAYSFTLHKNNRILVNNQVLLSKKLSPHPNTAFCIVFRCKKQILLKNLTNFLIFISFIFFEL